jgi:hypothetical protein
MVTKIEQDAQQARAVPPTPPKLNRFLSIGTVAQAHQSTVWVFGAGRFDLAELTTDEQLAPGDSVCLAESDSGGLIVLGKVK